MAADDRVRESPLGFSILVVVDDEWRLDTVPADVVNKRLTGVNLAVDLLVLRVFVQLLNRDVFVLTVG